MSKVIFLDFDGVLLTDQSARQQVDQGLTVDNYLRTVVFDTACVQNLLELIDQSSASVVLSTSWAMGTAWSEISTCLMRNGVDPSLVWEWDDPSDRNYMTPRRFNSSRAHEIQSWISLHAEVEHWVALDDDISIAGLAPHAVVTDPRRGLDKTSMNNALRALKITAV